MQTYMDRYLQGEHMQVWKELIVLQEQVSSDKYLNDAIAVARETMRRARYNIELLVQRLPHVGYELGYAHRSKQKLEASDVQEVIEDDADFWRLLNPDDPDEMKHLVVQELTEDTEEWIAHKPATWKPAATNSDVLIARLEQTIGVLPLSLRAWYEQVGEVNFTGQAPSHWLATPPRMVGNQIHSFDPLYIVSLADVLQHHRYQATNNGYNVYLAPHELFKEEKDDNGGYGIHVPSPYADTLFQGEWHHVTFVEYLRICFKWAGLPGLEFYSIPQDDLMYLLQGLLDL